MRAACSNADGRCRDIEKSFVWRTDERGGAPADVSAPVRRCTADGRERARSSCLCNPWWRADGRLGRQQPQDQHRSAAVAAREGGWMGLRFVVGCGRGCGDGCGFHRRLEELSYCGKVETASAVGQQPVVPDLCARDVYVPGRCADRMTPSEPV